jgi:anthranilate synthase component 2
MEILVIDNYDSFTYNLVHLLEKYDAKVTVIRPDELPLSHEIRNYKGVVISPGPGLPSDYPMLFDFMRQLPANLPVLGVCLGLQVMTVHLGGSLKNLASPLHGRSVTVNKCIDSSLLKNVSQVFKTGRYHSWIVNPADLPDCLEITASDNAETIQGLRHKELPWEAVQFHPESVLTEEGETMLKNWVDSIMD